MGELEGNGRPLTDEEVKKVNQWMWMTLGTPKCPMCGESVFDPGEIGVIPSRFVNSQTLQGVLVVSMACRNCSYILLFSAIHMGLA
jgi:predicted nucleic-acid-binding Zn-ribbon protein